MVISLIDSVKLVLHIFSNLLKRVQAARFVIFFSIETPGLMSQRDDDSNTIFFIDIRI